MFCVKCIGDHRVQQQLLASFGQCADMPVFVFHPQWDSIDNLLTLYAAARPVERFHSVRAPPPSTVRCRTVRPSGAHPHAVHRMRICVFAFCAVERHGACLCPVLRPDDRPAGVHRPLRRQSQRSGGRAPRVPALEVDATGETVASVFQRRHVWLPAGSGARLEPRAGRGSRPCHGWSTRMSTEIGTCSPTSVRWMRRIQRIYGAAAPP